MATILGTQHSSARQTLRPHHARWTILLGFFLTLHGLIHGMGFVVAWKLAQINGMPYHTTVLAARVDLGASGIRIIGLFWFLAALGLVVVGLRLAWSRRLQLVLIAPATVFSLTLCILGWPDSASGAVIDVSILAVLALVTFRRS